MDVSCKHLTWLNTHTTKDIFVAFYRTNHRSFIGFRLFQHNQLRGKAKCMSSVNQAEQQKMFAEKSSNSVD